MGLPRKPTADRTWWHCSLGEGQNALPQKGWVHATWGGLTEGAVVTHFCGQEPNSLAQGARAYSSSPV